MVEASSIVLLFLLVSPFSPFSARSLFSYCKLDSPGIARGDNKGIADPELDAEEDDECSPEEGKNEKPSSSNGITGSSWRLTGALFCSLVGAFRIINVYLWIGNLFRLFVHVGALHFMKMYSPKKMNEEIPGRLENDLEIEIRDELVDVN